VTNDGIDLAFVDALLASSDSCFSFLFLFFLFYSGLTVLTKEQALLANLKAQRMIHL